MDFNAYEKFLFDTPLDGILYSRIFYREDFEFFDFNNVPFF